MKKKIVCTLIAFLAVSALFAQKDQVVGYWLTEEGQSQVHIFEKNNGKMYGKIVWLEEPLNEDGSPKRDIENMDEEKQHRKILGMTILKDFEYDQADEKWENGKIYDPESGKTYDCYMWFDGNNKVLNVKGYIGLSVIGRKTEWTRETEKR